MANVFSICMPKVFYIICEYSNITKSIGNFRHDYLGLFTTISLQVLIPCSSFIPVFWSRQLRFHWCVLHYMCVCLPFLGYVLIICCTLYFCCCYLGGAEYAASHLDGVFSFVILDCEKRLVCVGRDTYGVRPSFRSVYPSILIYYSFARLEIWVATTY